jgi:hypothetical protein
MRADSENGYINEFDIYTGKTRDNQNPELGLTSRVFIYLIRRLENKNHIVNIDHYFKIFDLFKILKGKRIYDKRTARSNYKIFPGFYMLNVSQIKARKWLFKEGE